jgi:ribonuclease P protein subunit RPR2
VRRHSKFSRTLKEELNSQKTKKVKKKQKKKRRSRLPVSQMAKQNKEPRKPSVPNKDGFARASFLFQAAHFVRDGALSRMYIRSMDLVTKKGVLKVCPHVKRIVCKKCNRLQKPGRTCTAELEDEFKKSETLEIRCICGANKRFPVGKDREYVLFADRKT